MRYLLDHLDLVIETTDAPGLEQAGTQYRRDRILTKADMQMSALGEPCGWSRSRDTGGCGVLEVELLMNAIMIGC